MAIFFLPDGKQFVRSDAFLNVSSERNSLKQEISDISPTKAGSRGFKKKKKEKLLKIPAWRCIKSGGKWQSCCI